MSERHCAPLSDAQRCPAGTECPWGLSCSALPFLAPGEPGFLSFTFSLALGRVHLAGSFAHHTLRSTSLPIMASLHLSPSSPISLSDYPLSYQFSFLHPSPCSDSYTPSWCFHHKRMNPQVPYPILFKGKGSQRVGDIDPLKLYDRC